MGKLRQKRRQQERKKDEKEIFQKKRTKVVLEDDLEEDETASTNIGGFPVNDIEATIRTLRVLSTAGQEDTLSSKPFKALRVSLYEFFQSETWLTTTKVAGKSCSGRIGDALRDKRLDDAYRFLEEMRQNKQTPKIGALQRWVRDCDAAGDGTEHDNLIFKILDCMLRLVDPKRIATSEEDAHADQSLDIKSDGRIRTYPDWRVEASEKRKICEEKLKSQIETSEKKDYKSLFTEIAREKGQDRRIPNEHDLVTYHSAPNAINYTKRSETTEEAELVAERFDAPFVSGAFLMRDILSPDECKQIIDAAENIGYTPDKPLNGSPSVLADNFMWLVDDDLLNEVFERCKPLLPPTVEGFGVAGINANWRLFKYHKDAVYRPHIDGSWPGSGLVDGKLQFDKFGDRWSKFTFLLYLNEDFEGGCTTFYTPSSEFGVVNARGIKPTAGSVVIFPHGTEYSGALLHKGSPPTSGIKYIVRSDVLYKNK